MIRQAYLAGSWYPKEKTECRNAIEQYEDSCAEISGDWLSAMVPHAGWYYSGAAMEIAYRSLAKTKSDAELVVIFGSHRGVDGPNTIFLDEGWDTPLGVVFTDNDISATVNKLLNCEQEPCIPQQADNAIEVQLPFIRHFFPRARLLMLGVAASVQAIETGRLVGDICRQSGRNTIFVGSTDLTHYGTMYGFTPQGSGAKASAWVRNQNDRGFLEAMLSMNYLDAIAHAQKNKSACCPGAAVAAFAARQSFIQPNKQTGPTLAKHYLSCDINPSFNFVGYGSLMF